MADSPTRRLTDRSNGPPTVIGAGVQFRGDIIAPGAVMLSGTVHGDGDVAGMLTIARDAHWEGQVRARSGVVAGHLTGSIVVSDRLEVGAACCLEGGAVNRIDQHGDFRVLRIGGKCGSIDRG